jgi:chorismate mutase
MRKSVSVEAEVDLGEFSDGELLEELKERGKWHNGTVITVKTAIGELRDAGLPRDILEQLEDWERQPIIDSLRLKNWLELCGVSRSSEVLE